MPSWVVTEYPWTTNVFEQSRIQIYYLHSILKSTSVVRKSFPKFRLLKDICVCSLKHSKLGLLNAVKNLLDTWLGKPNHSKYTRCSKRTRIWNGPRYIAAKEYWDCCLQSLSSLDSCIQNFSSPKLRGTVAHHFGGQFNLSISTFYVALVSSSQFPISGREYGVAFYYETPLIQTPMTSRWLLIKRNPWPTTFGSCSFASKLSKFSQLHVKASDWQSSIRISVSWTESSVGPVELWWVLPGKFYIKT